MKARAVLPVRAGVDKSDMQFQVDGNGDDAEADSELADCGWDGSGDGKAGVRKFGK